MITCVVSLQELFGGDVIFVVSSICFFPTSRTNTGSVKVGRVAPYFDHFQVDLSAVTL